MQAEALVGPEVWRRRGLSLSPFLLPRHAWVGRGGGFSRVMYALSGGANDAQRNQVCLSLFLLRSVCPQLTLEEPVVAPAAPTLPVLAGIVMTACSLGYSEFEFLVDSAFNCSPYN